MGAGISGTLFQRNRYARSQRMGKIDLEYQMGDLRATYRGARTNKLSELRGKRRVVAVVGPTELVAARMCRGTRLPPASERGRCGDRAGLHGRAAIVRAAAERGRRANGCGRRRIRRRGLPTSTHS